jgi:hypothetical protein
MSTVVQGRKGLPHKAKGTKKGRKYGRNKMKCARYKFEGRHEKSHRRRILKHIEKYKDTSVGTREALLRYGGAA